ncbi:Palmitoyltransferase akr1, ankyrin repeat-containing protein akr1 [Delphinella strobiligena]|nr:Palmitoyltransferase akr1, ankyrin repeat-containing protein akr1 [Delphinella strobiligena]
MESREEAASGKRERSNMTESNNGAATSVEAAVELDSMKTSPPPPPPPPTLAIEEDLMALARLGELRAIQKLFDSGKYTASSTDDQGITALHWAAINGHYALCHFLLQSGAQVNARGGDALATPVLWASKKCNLDIVSLLLRNGADALMTDDQGYNLLHCATLDGNVFQLILLLHEGDLDVDVPDTQGHTSLMWAAYKGFPACVDVLLRWGADVHKRDSQGFTALHWALVKGSYMCVQKLLEYGADRFAANNEGKTPAVTAQEMNSVRQWHKALSDTGFDNQGHPKQFPLSFVKDTRKFLDRFFFTWPTLVLGATLYILAWMPIYFGLPLSMLTSYCLQWSSTKLLVWAPSDMKHIHKTSFLAGVFAASLFWVGLRYLTHILPATILANPFLNLTFALSLGLTAYYYFKAMFADPGFIPKSGSRAQQKTTIDNLLESRIFDDTHFCTTCMIRKPLRSKHCRRCNRCVSRQDHHCPWINNCVGLQNHRDFVLYIFFLFLGLSILIRLTIAYIDFLPVPTDPALVNACSILKPELCAQWCKDPFTLVVNGWGFVQLTWTTMLLFVQLSQIGRAMTTYESMKGQHTGTLTTALTTGSTSPETIAGSGPHPNAPSDPAHVQRKNHKESCFTQWKKLLGLDTFFAIALHGSRGPELMARRKRNPFNRGCIRNCGDFWCDAGKGPAGVLFGNKADGKGLLGGEAVDYRKLYEVPARMRYRQGDYEAVEQGGEEV